MGAAGSCVRVGVTGDGDVAELARIARTARDVAFRHNVAHMRMRLLAKGCQLRTSRRDPVDGIARCCGDVVGARFGDGLSREEEEKEKESQQSGMASAVTSLGTGLA